MNTVFRFKDSPLLMEQIEDFAKSFKLSVSRINDCHSGQILVHENHDSVEMELNDSRYLSDTSCFDQYEANAEASLDNR
jgi:hypothetical protein